MKSYILPGILAMILGIIAANLDTITDMTSNLVSATPSVIVETPNSYVKNDNFVYVQKTDDFIPYSKQDLLNIFYSIFDNGYDTFTFYCPSEYSECLDDVEAIASDKVIITDIGNYVHPFNNFTYLQVVTGSLGEVNVVVTKLYSPEMIASINAQMDKIFAEQLEPDMDINDKILKIHDYIINNTYYDQENGENSGNAYGTLIEGKSKCAGYADAMAIALARLGVKNYKVASQKHVWNALYLDDEWSQIDLTWDDPIVEDGGVLSETIRHKFYMINTDTILSYDTDEHSFDQNIYIELRQN